VTTDRAAHQQSQRAGKRILVVLAAVFAVGLLLCLGFAPVAFQTVVGGDSEDGDLAMRSCGAELAIEGVANIKGLKKEQLDNAAIIVDVGYRMKIPPRGWVIAVATALQESSLHNVRVAVDHDSLGLFQQRPSMGWGTPAQLLDPRYASAKFYQALARKAPNWQTMRLADAAQRVQVSFNGSLYQRWEPMATAVVNQLAEGAASGAGGGFGDPARCVRGGEISGAGWTMPAIGNVGSGFRTPSRPTHDGVDVIIGRGQPIFAAAGGLVVTSMCQASSGTCDTDGGPHIRGCGWYVKIRHAAGLSTLYCHMLSRPRVSVGDRVEAGQQLGVVGSSGNSSGPHLHFEVRLNGGPINPVPFMAARGAPLHSRA
jgi:murein DD-endopeptidase MepM/ murein hydrolase activator NlpD